MRHIESSDDFSKSVCNFLIKSNAKINIEDRYGQTPLHYCAMRGNEIVTKELLALPGINFEVSLISRVLLTWIYMYMTEKACR
jgi:ankyrin repeat protein